MPEAFEMTDTANPFASSSESSQTCNGFSQPTSGCPNSMAQPVSKGYYSAELVAWMRKDHWDQRCKIITTKGGFVFIDDQFAQSTSDGAGLKLRIDVEYLPGPKTCEIAKIRISDAEGNKICEPRPHALASASRHFLYWLAKKKHK